MAPRSYAGRATARPTLALQRVTTLPLPWPAPGAAPVGLGSTGNPVFNVPASMLGIPALSLPLLSTAGLPLGLQIAGFVGEDAQLFAVAAAIRDLLAAAC